MPLDLHVGDQVELKKPHPCGSNRFEITRVGMDFRSRCTGCNHEAWIPRVKLEKSVRKVYPKESEAEE